MHKQKVTCPGCGIQLYSENVQLDKEFNASLACRELNYQLSYYTLSSQDSYFIHQLVVDTYASQHYGEKVKPITITFALVGLYLVNEKNYTGKQVQQVHVTLANRSKVWTIFSVPTKKASITIKDVIASQETKKQEMIKKWCGAVWEVWKPEEEKIKTLLKRYGDI